MTGHAIEPYHVLATLGGGWMAAVTVGRWRRDRGVQARRYDVAPDGSLIIAPEITCEPPGTS